ncbi:SAM-dependent methyltransferase [Salipaludibacillus keqinensis]|uniref:SAM-dependent methyltransferase n=1 Tax=Salipaludibacillus keqinensis TaxID=2045207 RepID=A0A323TMB3_9BACI|nr:class I SAM-dependent methyltransferase [Salipaludibacillus keqinensis]PYZ95186.1 SAM-dependent methyltransferase [Salipaludibacillus keqinensis]
MTKFSYLDVLAKLEVTGAHPGGMPLTRSLLSKEAIQPESHVLDAGCGLGETSVFLAKTYRCQVQAIDQHTGMVSKAREKLKEFSHAKVHQGSLENLPFSENEFDFVLSESVLTFLNTDIVLKEIYRVLKKDGCFIMNEMALLDLLSNQEMREVQSFYNLHSCFTANEWIEKLKVAGFLNIELIEAKEQLDLDDPLYDLSLSVNLEEECLNTLDEHMKLTKRYKDQLGYVILKCAK